jgi:hypothetical protein
MKPGGTLNTRVFLNDMNQIQSGQFYAPALIRLPLIRTFRQGATGSDVAQFQAAYGGRPDLRTDTGRNPIVGNVAAGAQIIPARIQVQEPANCLQLLWHALDASGNYQASYPIVDPTNCYNGSAGFDKGWPLTGADQSLPQHWAFGWLRLNGLGPWFPMSLLPSTMWMTESRYLSVFPFGGYSSITAPMSFFDWVGYWDGAGNTNGVDPYLLAVTSINTSVSSNGATLGNVSNYATPSGSGIEPQAPNTDTQRSQDILVRSGNGR